MLRGTQECDGKLKISFLFGHFELVFIKLLQFQVYITEALVLVSMLPSEWPQEHNVRVQFASFPPSLSVFSSF